MSSITIDTSDVAEALLSLNITKASGTDVVSPLILKVCSDSFISLITHKHLVYAIMLNSK